jgi:organic radical activating enzyme
MLKYPIAEVFHSLQGEGQWTGTPMFFIRLVGCSVGKSVCTHCDTMFEEMYPEKGGGLFTSEELVEQTGNARHVCLTGGEPLDRNLESLLAALTFASKHIHIESSGTKHAYLPQSVWLTVSPKPNFLEVMMKRADEIKIILNGLGDSPRGWPTLSDALRWAREAPSRPVFLQPVNFSETVDTGALREAQDTVLANPTLRLSAQMHKFLHVR